MVVRKQSFGLKIAQAGYDVNNCPDYALAFNSSWPSLPVVKEITETVTPTPYLGSFWQLPNVTITHDLGFYALGDVWETGRNTNTGDIKTIRNNARLYLGLNSAYWQGGIFTSEPDPITVHIKIYNIDISKPIEYEYIKPPVYEIPYDNNFGLKIAKDNKSINSKDMRDFIIHTRCQSPAILTIRTEQDAVSNVISYTNPQGYTNWISGWLKTSVSNYYVLIPQQSQVYPKYTFSNGDTYTATISGTDKMSLVILRDPLLLAKTVEADY